MLPHQIYNLATSIHELLDSELFCANRECSLESIRSVSQIWIHQVFFLCLFPSKTVKDLEVNFLMSIEPRTTFCPTNSTVHHMNTDQPTFLLRYVFLFMAPIG